MTRARAAAWRGAARGAGLVGLYLAVAMAITWPLARHATTHVVLANIAALGDPWIVGWALACQARALAGLPLPGIFHPTPYSLYYGEAAFGALPLFAPAYLASGNPILAVNVVFLGGLALTAASLHAVVRRWTGSSAAGALAAWTFLTCPFSAWAWGPSAVNYVTLWYWPWIVLLASEPLATPRRAVALGLLVLAQGLTSFYVAVGVMGPLLALAAWRLARPRTRPAGRRLLGAAAIAAAGWAIVFAPHLLVRIGNPELGSQTFYPFFARLAVPSGLFDAGEPSGVAPAALALIVVGALATAHGTGSRRVAWRSALFWVAVGLVVALPPRLLVAGHAITTPVGWVVDAGVPVHAVRDNGRRGLAALVGLCMLTGVAYAEVAAWLARRGLAWLAPPLVVGLAAGIFHGLLRPVERRPSPAPTPGRYALFDAFASRRIASPIMAVLREPGGPLLELPTAPGPIHHLDAMHRAMVHGRPILNGFHGYWPATFPARMALACRLPDPAALATLRRETGLEMVLVHLEPQPIGRPLGPYACPPLAPGQHPTPDAPEQAFDPAAWDAVARGGRTDLTLVARDGSDLLFRVGP